MRYDTKSALVSAALIVGAWFVVAPSPAHAAVTIIDQPDGSVSVWAGTNSYSPELRDVVFGSQVFVPAVTANLSSIRSRHCKFPDARPRAVG